MTRSRTYRISEIFYSIQGEGLHSGRPTVFCRFAGCNLWSGKEHDRSSAVCRFCDTDFPVNKTMTRSELVVALASFSCGDPQWLVLTGGEPALQVDADLVNSLKWAGFEVAIETNGTIDCGPLGLDWTTVSPKAGTTIRQRSGDELKVVWPQPGLDLDAMAHWDFRWRYLQPMDGPDASGNTSEVVRHCLEDGRWSVSLQLHKVIGLP